MVDRLKGWSPNRSNADPDFICGKVQIMMDMVGRAAVPFALPDIEGHVHHLHDYAGRWLLLVFHRHLG